MHLDDIVPTLQCGGINFPLRLIWIIVHFVDSGCGQSASVAKWLQYLLGQQKNPGSAICLK